MCQSIDEVAAQYFGGNLTAMARANGITPPLLSRWKALGYIVDNGVVMSPRRELVDGNGHKLSNLKKK